MRNGLCRRHASPFLCGQSATRCYSQAAFERDDQALESAQRRKPDFAMASCGRNPGDRLLDVGCGWGSFVEQAGRRGIRVIGLTISHQSEQFVTEPIRRQRLPPRVFTQEFLTHGSPESYDAIVILE